MAVEGYTRGWLKLKLVLLYDRRQDKIGQFISFTGLKFLLRTLTSRNALGLCFLFVCFFPSKPLGTELLWHQEWNFKCLVYCVSHRRTCKQFICHAIVQLRVNAFSCCMFVCIVPRTHNGGHPSPGHPPNETPLHPNIAGVDWWKCDPPLPLSSVAMLNHFHYPR